MARVPFNPIRAWRHRALRRESDAEFVRHTEALRRWLAQITLPELDLNGHTLVFNTVRCDPTSVHLYTDLMQAYALRRCGARAIVLIDDGQFEVWDTIQRYRIQSRLLNPSRDPRLLVRIQHRVAELMRVYEMPSTDLCWYSDLLGPNPVTDADADALSHRYAGESTKRYLEQGAFDLDDPVHHDYYQRALRNAALSREVARTAIERFAPQHWLTSHGLYSTWGPAYREAKQQGLRTLVYAMHPSRFGGIWFEDQPGGSVDPAKVEDYLENQPFPEEARAESQAYLDNRFNLRASDTQEYFAHLGNTPPLSTGNHRVTFGLFPNITWDAVGAHLNPLYDGVLEWILDTMRSVAAMPDCRLLVRFHPGESTRDKGTQLTEDAVRAQAPELAAADNIELIASGSGANSYELLRHSVDVALVFTGTLGAEAQLLGVPVIAVADGRFSTRFTQRPDTAEDYRALLRDPTTVLSDFQARKDEIQRMAMKFHHYMSHELWYPMGVLHRQRRGIADSEQLQDPATFDQTGMARTLRKLVGTDDQA